MNRNCCNNGSTDTLMGPRGPRGPRGYMGLPGPAGPAGTPTPYNLLTMVHDSTDNTVEAGSVIAFDTIDLAIGITYSTTAGQFTLPTLGQYLVNWWVNAENSGDAPQVLVIDLLRVSPTTALISRSISGNPVLASLSQVLVGTAIIDVTTPDSVFEFQNSSADSITLSPESGYSAVVTVTRIN